MSEFLLGFLVAGTFQFWLALVVALGAGLITIATSSPVMCTLIMGLTMWWMSTYIPEWPAAPKLIAIIVGYIAIGWIWSIAEFYLKARRMSRIYDDARARGMSSSQAKDKVYNEADQSYPLKASNYIEHIYMAIIMWPLSMILSVMNDAVIRTIENIVEFTKGIYNRISIAQSSKYLEDQRLEKLAEQEARDKAKEQPNNSNLNQGQHHY